MVGLQIAATAPNPPPPSDEKSMSTSFEGFMKQRSGPMAVKAICWCAAIAEAAVILASHTPQLKLSQAILSALVLRGTAERIYASPMFILGTFLAGFGGFIRYQCYRELGRLFTFEMSIRKDHRLVTSGPYSMVRHPGYAGVVLTVVGIICWHACSGSWARECGLFSTKIGQAAAVIYLVLVSLIVTGLMARMEKEDEALWETFGDEWTDWARRVPYKLVPGLY
ncbi:Delta(14)-sterol reductase [Hypsizygus marmoreus]|uniref:Protein-S-isoprenylcysteine O-methyltransferase n=1 Tax=Hypsizygus marmoreus TaxID=39966 RepID=A0A369JB59_HYPMA|nr:Delta(14)-sterol reductase [Hypsizygus marmoreus]